MPMLNVPSTKYTRLQRGHGRTHTHMHACQLCFNFVHEGGALTFTHTSCRPCHAVPCRASCSSHVIITSNDVEQVRAENYACHAMLCRAARQLRVFDVCTYVDCVSWVVYRFAGPCRESPTHSVCARPWRRHTHAAVLTFACVRIAFAECHRPSLQRDGITAVPSKSRLPAQHPLLLVVSSCTLLRSCSTWTGSNNRQRGARRMHMELPSAAPTHV